MKGFTRRELVKKGKSFRKLALTGLFLMLGAGFLLALSVDGLFEFGDGACTPGSADILGDGLLSNGPDWADLFNADHSLKDTDSDGIPDVKEVYGGVDAIFLADQLAQGSGKDDTMFAQSNKNNDLIGTWNWDTGNVPPKDDFANVYAYATLNDYKELIIYAGLERLAPEGDSHIDLEFNQSTIGLDKALPCGADKSGGPSDSAPCEFLGEKTINDLLIVMDFEKGGKLGFVEVRKWNGSEYALVEEILGEGCDAFGMAGALNNGVDIDGGPWANYDRHGSVVDILPANGFTEVGLNVTKLLGVTPCFATFWAKSRSSPSFTSELKDFIFGHFTICGIEVTKGGPELSKIGDQATYTYTIENTGAATLYLVSVIDDKIGDLTEAASSAGCDILAPGESCTFDTDYIIPAQASDPFINTVTVTFNATADHTGSEVTDSDDHSVNLFQPSVEITKDGDDLSKAGDQVTYTFTITNTSSEDSPDLVLDSLTDSVIGDLTDPAKGAGCEVLAHGATCTFEEAYTVQPADDDPLNNSATVHYHPEGFSNDITDFDDHSLNLFQPSVEVLKGGDTLSKIGDAVTYAFQITNTGSNDSPALNLATVSDSLLGDLTATAASSGCASLVPGGSCAFQVNRVVLPSDPDPLPNTVTVLYHPEGFPNDIEDSDDHTVELFQPSVEITKSGDTLSKAGDTVTYNFTVKNTSSGDSPALILDSVGDTLLGDLTALANGKECGSLAPGAQCSFTKDRVVQAGDADPLPNTVTIHYHPAGFSNDIADSDDHSVNLFQASVEITKSGDVLSKIGDTVTYSFAIQNTGSSDSPALILDSLGDTLLGDLTALANGKECGSLAPGAQCSFTKDRVVQAGDADPLPNTVTTHYHPAGFSNDIADSDDHSVNLFQPSVTITKSGDAVSKAGDTITYTFEIRNSGSGDSPALILDSVSDTLLGDLTALANGKECGSLAPGAQCSFTKDRVVQAGDPDPLPNTVTTHYHPDAFSNDIADADDHLVDLVHPGLEVNKSCGPDRVIVGQQVYYAITINNTGDVALNRVSIADSLVGDLTDGTNPAITSSTCGTALAALATCAIDYIYTVPSVDPNPLVNEVTATYQVSGLPNQLTKMDQCSVDITGPEGCTPGFWKNHTELWDGVGTEDVTTSIKTYIKFNTAFDVTPKYSGISNNITLFEALSLSGSDLMALNRHASSALVNADSGITFPFSVNQVKAIYRDAVGADPGPETITSALRRLSSANEQDCPF